MTCKVFLMHMNERMPLNLSRAEYESTDALNWSRLKLIGQSPAHFKYGGGDDSSGFALGTAAHAAILEPEKFANDFVTFKGKVRRGNAWEEFEAESIRAGKTVVNTREHDEAVAIRDAVFRNKRAAQYLSGGQPEFSMIWNLKSADGSINFRCKGRGDYLSSVVADLKTTKDASPKAFARACANYGYFGQAAWYSDGYRILTGQTKPFVIIAVESSAPYVVQVYRLSEAALERGREQYMSLVGKLDYCTKNNFWGGYSEQEELELEAPDYFTSMEAA